MIEPPDRNQRGIGLLNIVLKVGQNVLHYPFCLLVVVIATILDGGKAIRLYH